MWYCVLGLLVCGGFWAIGSEYKRTLHKIDTLKGMNEILEKKCEDLGSTLELFREKSTVKNQKKPK